MGDHGASEVALRVNSIIKVLSEEHDGARLIKPHSDLFARLMHIATNPGEANKAKVAIVYHLYMARRMRPGPVDVYLKALSSICESVRCRQREQQEENEEVEDRQEGQQEEHLDRQEEDNEEDLGVQGGQEGQLEENLGVQGGQEGQLEENHEDDDTDIEVHDPEEDEDEEANPQMHETFESMTHHTTGPLKYSGMPRVPIDVADDKYGVKSIHPWTSTILASQHIVHLSLPKKLPGLNKTRRSTIMRFYRRGKMYAKLEDGRVARCPDQQLQQYVDKLNRKRGGDLTVEIWMKFVGQVISKQEGRRTNTKKRARRDVEDQDDESLRRRCKRETNS